MDMADLYGLTFDDIVEYLDRLGKALDPDANKHVQVAHDAALATSGLTPSILRQNYRSLPIWFDPVFVREMVDAHRRHRSPRGLGRAEARGRSPPAHPGLRRAGRPHHRRQQPDASPRSSVIRNAVTRSDAIVKTPSNDPLTALAIARTMAEMAPDHPLTRHLAVAYWKGGDIEVRVAALPAGARREDRGLGRLRVSSRHVTRYIQPGLELISLDPKRSATIVGAEAFESRRRMAESPASSVRRRHAEPGGLFLRAGRLRALGHRRSTGPRGSTGSAS